MVEVFQEAQTSGTFSLSTWAAAASVVTVLRAVAIGAATLRRAAGWKAARLSDEVKDLGANLDSMAACGCE